MTQYVAVADPVVVINNVAVPIVPNTFAYTEGGGEQNVRVESAGGGALQQVYSNNVATNLSMCKMSFFNTPENIAAIRAWKFNTNQNAISATSGTDFSRSFSNAALTSDYEVPLGAETVIEVEFKSNAAV